MFKDQIVFSMIRCLFLPRYKIVSPFRAETRKVIIRNREIKFESWPIIIVPVTFNYLQQLSFIY